jgi:hypothetical protein
MCATPRAPVNQWICRQAGRTTIDPLRRRAVSAFDVDDEDLTVGRNQHWHDGASSQSLSPEDRP